MSSPDSPRSRRRIVVWLGLLAVVLIAIGGGVYVSLSGGDVSDPNVEFRAEPTDTPAPAPAKKGADTFTWPLYGYSPLSVAFSSAGSTDSGGGSLTYLWDFGDGATSTDQNRKLSANTPSMIGTVTSAVRDTTTKVMLTKKLSASAVSSPASQ